VAISISTGIYDKLNNVGRVGGIVGVSSSCSTDNLIADQSVAGGAISGSFLFIVGVANSIIMYRIIKQRRRVSIRGPLSVSAEGTQERMQEPDSTTSPAACAGDEEAPCTNNRLRPQSHRHGNTLLMKIIGPVITFVDHPWKVSLISIWNERKVRPRI
jgi:high-affinity nickel-transport protein